MNDMLFPEMEPTPEERAHDALVKQAARWLQKQGCSVVFTEIVTAASETPDAIGWKSSTSHLVEVKVSRSDFLADRQKPFRREAGRGMGRFRWFLTPAGLVTKDDLPPLWGLLEWDGKSVRKKWPAVIHRQWDSHAETMLLLSGLRRVGQNCPAGVAIKVYTMENPRAKATLGVTIQPVPGP